MSKKSMNLAPFASVLAALLALGLPSTAGAAEKSAIKPQGAEPQVQLNRSQPTQSPKADARQMALMVRTRAAMKPAVQQMKPSGSAGIDPTRAMAYQEARQPRLDDRQLATIDAARSVAALPSQMMKPGRMAAIDGSRSVALPQTQLKPDLAGGASSMPAAMMGAAAPKDPGRTANPRRMSAEKAAQMQRAMRSPLAKWQVKHRTPD